MSRLSPQEEEFAGPSPRDGYYDVFISFRGKETRYGFTDTLYHSLLGSKIYTFIDADLAGNVIETLFEIIGRSRMALVVYSEEFASSHWCLTELELIMRRWEEKKMMMIPIFYKVDVHEVKHPTEKIIKYFDEHIKNYDGNVVRKWKDVITKIGNVSGYPYKDVYGRSERDFISMQVIVTIKKKLREWRETNLESSSSKPYNNNNNNSSSTTMENHDVFISFLGKDTRFDLVNNLYNALMDYRKEIKIFKIDRDRLKDDNIFKELTKILQCSNTTDQLVPIFYEITQPDLINQAVKGNIADHLQKHARNEKPETVQSWRNAIIELGNIVGWRYSTTHSHSKSEELADFIQELVEEISTMLDRIEDEKNESESSRNQQEDGDVDGSSEVDVSVVDTEVEEWGTEGGGVSDILKSAEKLEQLSPNDEQLQAFDEDGNVASTKEEKKQALALQTDITAEKEFVLTLDHSNFYETIKKHKFVVVDFYYPGNDRCKKTTIEYAKAASILSSDHPWLILAKVDADEYANQEIVSEYAINEVPTLKIFRDEGTTVHTYKGRRDAEGIVEFLKKQRGPASAKIRSAKDAIRLIGDNSVVIVGVFPKFSGEEYNNFIALSKKLRSDYEFAHTRDAKLLPRGDSSISGPLVRLFKPFDELFVDSMDFNVEALENFFEESSFPLLTFFNTDPIHNRYMFRFFKSQNAQAMLFMNFTDEAAEYMKAKYREVAEKFKGHGIIFMLVNIEANQEFFESIGFKEEQVPVIIIGESNGQEYTKANIEVDEIAPWVKDYKDGKLAPDNL